MSGILHAKTTRERLDQVFGQCAPHLQPVIDAVRHLDISMMFAPQRSGAFRLPRNSKPTIIIIGDDFDNAAGPDGFHMPSIRRAIRACDDFTVVSCEPQAYVYASAASIPAVGRHHSMLIETRPEQEIAWVSLIQKLAPGRHVLLATVKGGHA